MHPISPEEFCERNLKQLCREVLVYRKGAYPDSESCFSALKQMLLQKVNFDVNLAASNMVINVALKELSKP